MISKKVKSIPPSGIREFFDLVLGMKDVISLGVGEPDFITPWKIREKAITALEEGFTSYTSNKGLLRLRMEISRFLHKKYGLNYNPQKEMLITVGVSQGLDLAIRAVINPGDKVIVVRPCYVSYPVVVELSGGKVLFLDTSAKEGFKINIKQLSLLVKEKPKAIILNYPCNPTGVSYTKKELMQIWEILSKAGIIVISDEIYDHLSFDFPHVPFASLPKAKASVIYLGGFSKNFAMTGFRIGYVCATKEVIEAMTKIHAYVMLCAPIVSQFAAVEALYATKDVNFMFREYKRRRNLIVKGLNDLGLDTIMPQGAFYCFASIANSGFKSSLNFAKSFLFKEKVAIVPGGAFGSPYDKFVRISFAQDIELLKESLLRISRFIKKHGRKN